MNDATLRSAYELLTERRAKESHGDDCPPPDALVTLVERRGAEASRLAALDRVMACTACRADLELLRSIHVAAQAEGQAPATARERHKLPFPPIAAAAAVALVAAGAALWVAVSRDGAEDVLRGDAPAVDLGSPVTTVATDSPAILVWRAVPTATAYDVEVLDADGESAFRTQTRDTLVTAPLARGSYQWWVRARMPDGGVTRSELAPLNVGRR